MKKIHFISILVFVLALGACQTTVDIPLPPHEKRIVINGQLEAEKEIELYISQSYGPTEDLDASEVMLPDAKVELLKDGQLISTLVYRDTTAEDVFGGGMITLGKFVAEGIIGHAGETYSLRVSHPDYPTATSTATIPPVPRIISAELVKEAARKVYEDGYTEIQSLLRVTLRDTAAFSNFYKLEHLQFKTLDFWQGTDTVIQWAYDLGGEAILGSDGAYTSESAFVSDEAFNGQEKTISFLCQLPNYYVNNQPVTDFEIFEMELIVSASGEAYKNYIEKLQLQRDNQGGIGFLPSEPVIVDSNVENGYGMWGGVTQARFKVVF